jgi:hypothetical protein
MRVLEADGLVEDQRRCGQNKTEHEERFDLQAGALP